MLGLMSAGASMRGATPEGGLICSLHMTNRGAGSNSHRAGRRSPLARANTFTCDHVCRRRPGKMACNGTPTRPRVSGACVEGRNARRCTTAAEQMLTPGWTSRQAANMILDDGGDATMLVLRE